MNKFLSLILIGSTLLFFSCSKSSGNSSKEEARDPGIFSYEIITPTPNDPKGVYQFTDLGTVRESVQIRMFVEDNFVKLTAKCSGDMGSFYLNLNSPIELSTNIEDSGRKLYSVLFLNDTKAEFTRGELTCRFGFNSGNRIEFYLNNLNGAIVEIPSSVLSTRIEHQTGNNVQVTETVENLNNNPIVKISD